MTDTLKFAHVGDANRDYSQAGVPSNGKHQQWLKGGYDAAGLPLTVKGTDGAGYAFNRLKQFWPTRSATAAASTVDALLPSQTTQCTAAMVNGGQCVATAQRGDPIAKLRFRPRMKTIRHSNGREWGWVSIFDVVKPRPGDIVGYGVGGKASYQVEQNLPCINGPDGGFIERCYPCSQNGDQAGRCDVLLENAGEHEREHRRLRALNGNVDPVRGGILADLPCPLPTLALRIGESRVYYNIMSAEKGGARDTHQNNFYTCEYRSNAIQNKDDLHDFVTGFLEGDVAPCCPLSENAAASAGANPCWFVAHDADVPFNSGLPDDFAAGLLRNFAARISLRESMCLEEQRALLDEVNRAKQMPGLVFHASTNQALDELARIILQKDGSRKDCEVAMFTVDRNTQTTAPLWSEWRSREGVVGACSVAQTTMNRRLECGPGIQMRELTVVQKPNCGGLPCPPLVQYRFCHQTCNVLFGEPPGRTTCKAQCMDTMTRTYNQCRAVFNSDVYCQRVVDSERANCEQRCLDRFPDYICSSNLCLTPGRCDPFANRCAP
jgi:hypothetical protein